MAKAGGRREGAGCPPRNSLTTRIGIQRAAGGLLPLDYMLRVMRDENADKHRRDDMAKAAAPYLHARVVAHIVDPLGTIGLAEASGAEPPEGSAAALVGAQVRVYIPDNARRVAPPEAANDALAFMPEIGQIAAGSLGE